MLRAGMQFGPAGLLLVIILCLASSADAQHRRHYYVYQLRYSGQHIDIQRYSGRYDVDRRRRARAAELAETDSRSRRGGATFGAIVDQLIRVCGQQGLELQNWPFDSISQTLNPDETQRQALEQLRATAGQTADTLASACPRDILPAPSARLDAAQQAIETVLAALNNVQPVMKAFYGSLDDEQKARLLVKYMLASEARDKPTRRGRSRSYDDDDDRDTSVARRDTSAAQWDTVCGQWATALRDWPIRRIERDVRLTEPQRIAFYEVVSSSLKAAQALVTSCPAETALTPVGRMETMRKRLEAIRQAIATIHPALVQFYDALDNKQQTRFAEID